MANSVKKEDEGQHRHRHHPDVALLDGHEEDVDKEWEDFTRLMAKLRDSRTNRPNRPSQAFYPCPPPKEDDQQEFDPFDYLNTICQEDIECCNNKCFAIGNVGFNSCISAPERYFPTTTEIIPEKKPLCRPIGDICLHNSHCCSKKCISGIGITKLGFCIRK